MTGWERQSPEDTPEELRRLMEDGGSIFQIDKYELTTIPPPPPEAGGGESMLLITLYSRPWRENQKSAAPYRSVTSAEGAEILGKALLEAAAQMRRRQ